MRLRFVADEIRLRFACNVVEPHKLSGIVPDQNDLPAVAQCIRDLADVGIPELIRIGQLRALIDQDPVRAEHRRIQRLAVAVHNEAAGLDAARRHRVRLVALYHKLRALHAAVADKIRSVALHRNGLTVKEKRAAPDGRRFHDLIRRDRADSDAVRAIDAAVRAQQRAVRHVDELNLRVHRAPRSVVTFAAVEIPIAASVRHDRPRELSVAEGRLRRCAVQRQLQRKRRVVIPCHRHRAAVRRPVARELFLLADEHAVAQALRRITQQLEVHAVHARGVRRRLRQDNGGAERRQATRRERHCHQRIGILVALHRRAVRQAVAALIETVFHGEELAGRLLAFLRILVPLAIHGVIIRRGKAGMPELREVVWFSHGLDVAVDIAFGRAAAQIVVPAGELGAVAAVAGRHQHAVVALIRRAEQIGGRTPRQRAGLGGCAVRFRAAVVIPVVVLGVLNDLIFGQRAVVDADAAHAHAGGSVGARTNAPGGTLVRAGEVILRQIVAVISDRDAIDVIQRAGIT